MRKAEEIYDMINSRSGKVWNKKDIASMVAKVYATEAIKADREKIALSRGLLIVYIKGHAEIDKESILNLPIELP